MFIRSRVAHLLVLLLLLWLAIGPKISNGLLANIAAVSVLEQLISRSDHRLLEPAFFVPSSDSVTSERIVISSKTTQHDIRLAERLVEMGHPRLAGSFLVLSNRSDEAINILQRAQGDIIGAFMLAFAHAKLGHWEESWGLLRTLPGSDRYLREGSRWYSKIGKTDTAVSLLEMAAQISTPEIIRREAIYETLSKTWYQQMGNSERGVYWALKWREEEPYNLRAATWLGLLYIWAHQPEEARGVWQSVEEVTPADFCPYYYQLGQIQSQEGDVESAVESYQKAWQCDSSVPIVAWELGRLLQETGDTTKARELFHFVLQHSQDESLRAQASKALDDLAP